MRSEASNRGGKRKCAQGRPLRGHEHGPLLRVCYDYGDDMICCWFVSVQSGRFEVVTATTRRTARRCVLVARDTGARSSSQVQLTTHISATAPPVPLVLASLFLFRFLVGPTIFHDHLLGRPNPYKRQTADFWPTSSRPAWHLTELPP